MYVERSYVRRVYDYGIIVVTHIHTTPRERTRKRERTVDGREERATKAGGMFLTGAREKERDVEKRERARGQQEDRSLTKQRGNALRSEREKDSVKERIRGK